MEWTELLGQLVSYLQGIAPSIWQVAQRQALMDGVQLGVFALLTGIVAISLFAATRQFRRSEGYNRYEDEGALIVGYLFSLLMAGLAAALSMASLARFINPDYYAIKLLIQLVQ